MGHQIDLLLETEVVGCVELLRHVLCVVKQEETKCEKSKLAMMISW
jgi:hypothetical protein